MRGGSTPPLILFPRRCLRYRFKPLAFSAPPFVNNPSGSSPVCTYISLFSIWQCVVYDSNFDLQLQCSKGNNEDITVTYTISRRGSMLRLTDSNLSMCIEFLKL